jgi:hypothetical protein
MENTLPNLKSQWALQKHNYFAKPIVIFFPVIRGRYPIGTHWVSQQIFKFLKKAQDSYTMCSPWVSNRYPLGITTNF